MQLIQEDFERGSKGTSRKILRHTLAARLGSFAVAGRSISVDDIQQSTLHIACDFCLRPGTMGSIKDVSKDSSFFELSK